MKKKERYMFRKNAYVYIFTLLFLILLIIAAPPVSALFGIHRTCPRCEGIGRDPGTLFLTSCPTCGGDGEVGVFVHDEDVEDVASFLLVGVIIILVIAGGVVSTKVTVSTQSQVPTASVGKKYCQYCGAKNESGAVFCERCGKKIS
jgi:uncharacterized protein (DUF983 family)